VLVARVPPAVALVAAGGAVAEPIPMPEGVEAGPCFIAPEAKVPAKTAGVREAAPATADEVTGAEVALEFELELELRSGGTEDWDEDWDGGRVFEERT
jgi:hypothetical protein